MTDLNGAVEEISRIQKTYKKQRRLLDDLGDEMKVLKGNCDCVIGDLRQAIEEGEALVPDAEVDRLAEIEDAVDQIRARLRELPATASFEPSRRQSSDSVAVIFKKKSKWTLFFRWEARSRKKNTLIFWQD